MPAYTVADGVDDALRLAPSHLIVGEVRTGNAALYLLRALMSDHAGLTTFHADGPQKALFRLSVILYADAQVRFDAAKALCAQATDLLVHMGWQAPNRVWLVDITYIPTGQGWLYLAAVMDLFYQLIVGWSMADHMTDALTRQALGMALMRRPLASHQLLHRSDRGCQYTSGDFQSLLAQHHIRVSMSGVGNCYGRAPMESFFSLLKTELVHHQRYSTRQQAKASIFDYIELFYNRQRIHSALGYLTPLAFEQRWLHSFSLKEIDSLSPSHHLSPTP